MQTRNAIAVLLLGGTLLAGCATSKEPSRIALPAFQLDSSIDTADGVDRREAGFIAGLYMARYVSACGMPAEPVLERDSWVTKVWVGYSGTYAGKFQISRATGRVLYEPRRNRLTQFQAEMIERGIARTDRERHASLKGERAD